MIALILQGIGFGFAAGSSPGPLQSFIISTTLSRGWRRGIATIFSPLLSDIPIIIMMTLLLQQLPPEVLRFIQIAGGTFVLYLAWGTWRSLRAGTLIGVDDDTPEPPRAAMKTLGQATTINFLSPGPYIFWSSVTGPILIDGLRESVLHGAMFLLSFYGTFLCILAVLVLAFDRLRRLDERITRVVLVAAIFVLAVLGIVLIVGGILG